MDLLRKLLFPLAVLYGLVMRIRNYCYDTGIFRSTSFPIPVIAVGNLSVGGTGKTPMIEYLIRLLSPDHKVAVLSRGYKRKSKGFILAGHDASAESIGDEPFQYFKKFPEIAVAVDSDRKNGIENLISDVNPDVILLDDAFQHRRVKAGFYVLLTAYGDLFSHDLMLPTGNLREPKSGARRADVIVVTKCPDGLSDIQMAEIRRKLNQKATIFFTAVSYDDFAYSEDGRLPVDKLREIRPIVVAGIAKPRPFIDFLKTKPADVMTFPDHHFFSDGDVATMETVAAGRPIVTTEKDYVRLKPLMKRQPLFFVPIRTKFIKVGDAFDKTIKNYVGKSSADSSIH